MPLLTNIDWMGSSPVQACLHPCLHPCSTPLQTTHQQTTPLQTTHLQATWPITFRRAHHPCIQHPSPFTGTLQFKPSDLPRNPATRAQHPSQEPCNSQPAAFPEPPQPAHHCCMLLHPTVQKHRSWTPKPVRPKHRTWSPKPLRPKHRSWTPKPVRPNQSPEPHLDLESPWAPKPCTVSLLQPCPWSLAPSSQLLEA
eukprot:324786-Chlamydomonas_euryale.AAC.4